MDRRERPMDQRPVKFRLLLVTDRRAVGPQDLFSLLERICAGSPRGTLAIQVREKDLPGRDLFEMVCRVKAVASPYDVPVIVNDRLDIAIASRADGLHLPASGLPPEAVRPYFQGLVGVSTHSEEEVRNLDGAYVDYGVFGPVFDTPSKRPFGPPKGVEALRRAVAQTKVPIFAIGGVNPQTVTELRGTGIRGIAVISAVFRAQDPVEAVLTLLQALV